MDKIKPLFKTLDEFHTALIGRGVHVAFNSSDEKGRAISTYGKVMQLDVKNGWLLLEHVNFVQLVMLNTVSIIEPDGEDWDFS